MNKLDQLRDMTDVVADTGDISAIETYRPRDATTNPSLLLKTAQLPRYEALLRQCVGEAGLTLQPTQQQLDQCVDNLQVAMAREILAIVPGRVSLDVDARLSFDTTRTLAKARGLVECLQREGIERESVLIKIAATWEDIQAARQLEQEGIRNFAADQLKLEQLLMQFVCRKAG